MLLLKFVVGSPTDRPNLWCLATPGYTYISLSGHVSLKLFHYCFWKLHTKVLTMVDLVFSDASRVILACSMWQYKAGRRAFSQHLMGLQSCLMDTGDCTGSYENGLYSLPMWDSNAWSRRIWELETRLPGLPYLCLGTQHTHPKTTGWMSWMTAWHTKAMLLLAVQLME